MHFSSIYSYILLVFIRFAYSASINNNTCTYYTEGCSYIPGYVNTALLSQRDVAYNISVDQLTTLGINMSSAVFSEYDYTTEALEVFQRVLGSGYRSIYLNMYWNHETSDFQVCPGKVPNSGPPDAIHKVTGKYGTHYCQQNFTLDDILLEMSHYIKSTDTDIAVNVMLLRLYFYDLEDSDDDDNDNSNNRERLISSKFSQQLSNRIYTPVDLKNDRDGDFTYGVSGKSSVGFPTAHRFLLTLKKRIMISASYMNLDRKYYDLRSDNHTIFEIDKDASGPDYIKQDAGMSYVGDETPKLCHSNSTEYLSSINSTTTQSWRTILDTEKDPFTKDSIRDYVQCGFSPVVNTKVDSMPQLAAPVDASIWTWSLGQPSWNHKGHPKNGGDSSGGKQDGPVAWKCAILDHDGWKVANCYDKYKSVCRINDMSYKWEVSEKENNYFEAINSCKYAAAFSVPRTALQNKAAIVELNESLPLWIDFNSVSVDNCWVTGGAYASCPYHPVSTNRNEVVKLSVAALVAFLLIVLLLLLKFDEVPTKKHQNRWRRLVNKASEEEYEGVPA